MSSKTKLKSALSALDSAESALRRALHSADADSATYIRRAISELEDAQSDIHRAIRQLPEG